MKFNFLLTLFITAIACSGSPKKSEAGLLIGLAAGSPGAGAKIGLVTGITFEAFVIITDSWSVDASHFYEDGLGIGLTFGTLGVFTLLDVNASLSSNQLVELFQKKFPFIDNQESLVYLATLTKMKLNSVLQKNPGIQNTFIRFNRSEIEEGLMAADMKNEELNFVCEQLR